MRFAGEEIVQAERNSEESAVSFGEEEKMRFTGRDGARNREEIPVSLGEEKMRLTEEIVSDRRYEEGVEKRYLSVWVRKSR